MPTFRAYQPDPDFARIRSLLVNTRLAFESTFNWDLCRWNYARYFVAPLLGTWWYQSEAEGIRFWESTVGVWENDEGTIVGVAHVENPRYGEAFLQRHPDAGPALLAEMLDYAEAALVDREQKTLQIHVYEIDAALRAVLQERGYIPDLEHPGYDSEFAVADAPAPRLPPGYAIGSMAQGNNIERRCKVLGLGFNHPDPAEWATVSTYEEMQRAPDYRADLDLYVVGPDGEYVSCCVVWYDEANRRGTLEPVCTHPDYRREGFGREVVLEGVRRAAARGAEAVEVGSGQPFYLSIGFRRRHASHPWTKTF
ncbi:MAG: GNAT family N-acetyltransferase [Chloroflexi bacterium]|nr:GNAT family N-acetyltransferase [Chloroflexota bacterium]MBU1746607.1 GNAT family N-acetyltransferase [Chloroflexota bacterium]